MGRNSGALVQIAPTPLVLGPDTGRCGAETEETPALRATTLNDEQLAILAGAGVSIGLAQTSA